MAHERGGALRPAGVVHARSGTAGELLLLSAPLVVSFVSFSMMGFVDSLVLGRIGTAEQGAVGLAAMLAWLLVVVPFGTMTAVNTFVAQDFGAGRLDALRRPVQVALVLVVPATALVWLCMPAVSSLISLIGTDPRVALHVYRYLSVRLLGAPVVLVGFALTGFLRGLGDMRTPMVVMLVANAVNALLAVVLVFGWWGLPRMGVAGAAWASVIGGTIETTLYVAVYLAPRHARAYGTRRWVRLRAEEFGRFLRVGVPIGFAFLFDMFSWTFFSVYASTLAPASLAAHMILFQILHLSFLPAAAVATAGTTLVGQYLGARRPDLAARAARWTFFACVGYMAATGLAFALFRRSIIPLFNPDPAVLAVGSTIFLIAAAFQPFDGTGIAAIGILRGAGDTRYPMLAMLGCAGLVFVPGVYLLGERLAMGIVGAWLAALAYVVLLGLVLVLRYRRGAWKTIVV